MNRGEICPKCKQKFTSYKLYLDFDRRDCTSCSQFIAQVATLTNHVAALREEDTALREEVAILKKKIIDQDNKHFKALAALDEKDAEIQKLQEQLIEAEPKQVIQHNSKCFLM